MPVARPFHRRAELPRRRADENLLRIERALAAETAADVGRDDAQRDGPADRARRPARRGRCRGFASPNAASARRGPARIRRGTRAARSPARSCGACGSGRRPRTGALAAIAASTSPRLNSRATSTLVPASSCSSGAPGAPRSLRIGGASQRLEIDVDQLERVLGEIAALGDHADDRLADMAHLVARQRQDRRRVIALHARGREQRLDVVRGLARSAPRRRRARRARPRSRSTRCAHARARCAGTRRAARARPAGRRRSCRGR